MCMFLQYQLIRLFLFAVFSTQPYRHINMTLCSVKVTTDSTFSESLDMVEMADFMVKYDRDDRVISICNNSTAEIVNIAPVTKDDRVSSLILHVG